MDEYEIRVAALGMAREILGKEASLQDILDLAWKLSSFIIEGWSFKEIETVFVENT